MARRLFRKLVPNEKRMQQSRALRFFGSTVLNRRLWHINRHSTAFGVATGLFWAWIALPIQTLGAIGMAAIGRGNVPLAMAFTWISNPVTWIPCIVVCYWVGVRLTGVEPIQGIENDIRSAMTAGFFEGLSRTGQLIVYNLPQLYPVYIGGVVLGFANGLLGYVAVKLTWRWNVVRRWHHRHEKRLKLNPAQRLTRGLAHIYRPGGAGKLS